MKKLIILICFVSLNSFAQDEIKTLITKINKNLVVYGSDPELKEVFLNQQEKILDIDGSQIPIQITKEIYEPHIDKKLNIVGRVSFECGSGKKNDNCIYFSKENKFGAGVGFAFKSKKGAYLFIDLIYQLKKELSYY